MSFCLTHEVVIEGPKKTVPMIYLSQTVFVFAFPQDVLLCFSPPPPEDFGVSCCFCSDVFCVCPCRLSLSLLLMLLLILCSRCWYSIVFVVLHGNYMVHANPFTNPHSTTAMEWLEHAIFLRSISFSLDQPSGKSTLLQVGFWLFCFCGVLSRTFGVSVPVGAKKPKRTSSKRRATSSNVEQRRATRMPKKQKIPKAKFSFFHLVFLF